MEELPVILGAPAGAPRQYLETTPDVEIAEAAGQLQSERRQN
jgi:hypothetical protein